MNGWYEAWNRFLDLRSASDDYSRNNLMPLKSSMKLVIGTFQTIAIQEFPNINFSPGMRVENIPIHKKNIIPKKMHRYHQWIPAAVTTACSGQTQQVLSRNQPMPSSQTFLSLNKIARSEHILLHFHMMRYVLQNRKKTDGNGILFIQEIFTCYCNELSA
jgi:hypothetical protein